MARSRSKDALTIITIWSTKLLAAIAIGVLLRAINAGAVSLGAANSCDSNPTANANPRMSAGSTDPTASNSIGLAPLGTTELD
eukprot:2538622-Amphidinium_carterae.1